MTNPFVSRINDISSDERRLAGLLRGIAGFLSRNPDAENARALYDAQLKRFKNLYPDVKVDLKPWTPLQR